MNEPATMRDSAVHATDDAASAPHDAGKDATSQAPEPYREPPLAMPQRSDETRCQLNGTRADSLPRLQAAPIWDELRFTGAFGVAAPSGSDAVYVFQQDGLVQRIDSASTPVTALTVLDLRGSFPCCEHGGLRGLAFHPSFDSNGYVFAFYVVQSPVRRARIVRFSADPTTFVLEPGSERAVMELELPGEGHEGGPLLFDRDGMLLIAFGDGGVEPIDTHPLTPSSLLGALARIDVDAIDSGGSYAIPDDNPFATSTIASVPHEVYAFGLRDPQHCSLDTESGELWCTDRGPMQSELNLIQSSRHYGWPVLDGALCTDTGRLCLDAPYELPFSNYRHFEGDCGVIGGQVSGGAAEPLFDGAVVYGDACSGWIAGVASRGDHAGRGGRMGALGVGLRALGADGHGDLLAIDENGQALRFALAPDGRPGTFPQRLSETGCYTDLAAHELVPELIEYRVHTPLWSDGTHKRRFLRLPAGTQIEAPADETWTFPVGTVLVKQFALQLDDRDASSVQPIETRFLVQRREGWEFYSYRWNDAATEAELVSKEVTVDYSLQRGGETRMQSYLFPSAAACPTCHSGVAGRVLGVRSEQLSYELAYRDEAAPHNQLALLAEQGLFVMPAGEIPAWPDPADTSLGVEPRARSYLQANCAHCHQPGGYAPPELTLDLRYELSLAETHTCGIEPQYFARGRALIAPSEPDQSAILIRMRDTGLDRMPPLATSVVDPLGNALLTSWIDGLPGCPDE